MVNGTCPAEDFLLEGDKSTQAWRDGLLVMLQHIADLGLAQAPTKWFHEANKPEQIYEFRKGPLRLFFFKGKDKQIAVCACGSWKKQNKADLAAVEFSAKKRTEYMAAYESGLLTLLEDE